MLYKVLHATDPEVVSSSVVTLIDGVSRVGTESGSL